MGGDPDLEKEAQEKDVRVSNSSLQRDEKAKEEPEISPVESYASQNLETFDDIEKQTRGRRDSRSSHSSIDSQLTVSDHDLANQTPSHRDRSRAQSSTRSVLRDAVKVPRNKRRGLLGRFTIIAEVTDAHDYPRSMKWMLTFVIAVAGSAAPIASSIVLPALVDITKEFKSTATIVNLSISLYMLSMSIFPLWWSSFSETLGRRTIYLTSFTLYVIFSIMGAVSTSIGMFLASRILSGGAAASVQAVGAGSIADIWEVKERGRAMGIFYLGPLCGPLLAPIVGGALTQGLGWRSCQWFLVILGVIIVIFMLFCFPETLKRRKDIATEAEAEVVEEVTEKGEQQAKRPPLSRVSTRQSVQLKTKKYLTVLRRCFIDPLRICLYLQFPAVAVSVLYATVTFCALYSLNISVQQTFSSRPYNYPSIIVGLTYIPNSLGYFLTSIFGGKWVDNIMAREAKNAGRVDEKGKPKYLPEDRLNENAWVGCFMYPAALIMYGWTAQYGVNLAAPLVANFFFGIGSMLIFAAVTTMLTEFMPKKASNGVALNNFVRNIFSCVGSAVTEPLIQAIGNGALFTIFGGVSLITGAASIWAMKRYGNHWRITMDRKMASVMGD